MIEIPRNTFEVPNECRERVVEGICNAMLSGRIYHVHSWTSCRRGDNGVALRDNGTWCLTDIDAGKENENAIRFRGCEMREAFKILISSGYHIFRVYEYRYEWPGYRVYRTPYVPNGSCYYEGSREVFSFDENIDY